MKKNNAYLVIGLGEFGLSVVDTLSALGNDLIVVDKYESKLTEVAEKVTEAICADASDPDVLDQIDLEKIDAAFVATSRDFTASVLITIQLKGKNQKDAGRRPYVIVKANNELEGKALECVGADRVVYPEKEMGCRIANLVAPGYYLEEVDLSDEHAITTIGTLKELWGKTIIDLDFRNTYKMTILGVYKTEDNEEYIFKANPGASYVIEQTDTLLVLGDTQIIKTLKGKTKR